MAHWYLFGKPTSQGVLLQASHLQYFKGIKSRISQNPHLISTQAVWENHQDYKDTILFSKGASKGASTMKINRGGKSTWWNKYYYGVH